MIEEHWPQALEFTESIAYQLDSLATGRCRDGKPWGVAHPRSRPSVFLTFERVHLANPDDEGPSRGTPAHAFDPRWSANASRRQIPRRPWIVENHVMRSVVTALIAPPGMGKTQWIASFALAVATGRADILATPIKERARGLVLESGRRLRRNRPALCKAVRAHWRLMTPS